MNLTINISDERASELESQAAAAGLSLEEWIQKFVEQERSDPIDRSSRLQTSSWKA